MVLHVMSNNYRMRRVLTIRQTVNDCIDIENGKRKKK